MPRDNGPRGSRLEGGRDDFLERQDVDAHSAICAPRRPCATENDTGDPEIGFALAELVRAWVFPATGDTAVTVNYPFTFTSAQPDDAPSATRAEPAPPGL
jgi:hypothetical protein